MKLIEFLDSIESFDGELATPNLESQDGFVWDNSCYQLTKEGKIKFKEILNKEIKINNHCIKLQQDVNEELYDLFMSATAGSVTYKYFMEWFKEMD